MRTSLMKLILACLTFCLGPFSVPLHAQGTVQFMNRLGGSIDEPVFGTDGVTRLDSRYAAQLHAGPAPDALAPVGEVVRFRDGGGRGYWTPPNDEVVIPTVPPGSAAFCQVRVWELKKGLNFDAAVRAASEFGVSTVFSVQTGGVGTPPSLPAMLLGLKSFKLEPPVFGAVSFSNLVPGSVDAPVLDVDGITRVEGTKYLAQLYVGTVAGELRAVGQPTGFGTGTQAGYWQATDQGGIRLDDARAGEKVFYQVKVWESAKGTNYESAFRAVGAVGQSKVYEAVAGAWGSGGAAPTLSGLESIRIELGIAGTIDFRSLIPGVASIRVQHPDPDGFVVDPRYVAQLYAALPGENLVAVGSPAPFGSADGGGHWYPAGDGVVVIPHIRAGEVAAVQVRVWDSTQGATYEKAVGLGRFGTSGTIQMRTGGSGDPVEPPAPLTGLESFRLREAWLSVRFNNLIPRIVDAPVFGPDGVTKVSGGAYLAQLYFDRNFSGTFRPAGVPVPFGTGDRAGYFEVGTDDLVLLTNFAVTAFAWVRVHVWDASQGATYEEARARGGFTRVSATYILTGTRAALGGLEPISFAPGRIDFRNRIAPNIELPVYGPEGELLEGGAWVAQLFFDETGTGNNLVALGSPAPFGTGADAGFWLPGPDPVITIPSVPPGTTITARVRVWDATGGANYNQAAVKASSDVFSLTVGGGNGPPTPLVLVMNPVSLSPPTLLFANLVPGKLDTPILDDNGARLAGPDIVAQLAYDFASKRSAIAPFGTGDLAGYFQPENPIFTIDRSFRPGTSIDLQLEVWDRSKGGSLVASRRAGGLARQIQISATVGVGTKNPGILSNFQPTRLTAGKVRFTNRPPGSLHDARVLGIDGTPLGDPNFVAQLGVLETTAFNVVVIPLGTPVPLGTGSDAGYFSAGGDGSVPVLFASPKESVHLVLRVWDPRTGATFASGAVWKEADLAPVQLGGGDVPPASLPMPQISFAQGSILFANFVLGKLDVPVLAPDGSRLAGPGFVAQLYMDHRPVGQPAPFGTGDQAGYWQAGDQAFITIPNLPAGAQFCYEVRIWEVAKGATFVESRRNGGLTRVIPGCTTAGHGTAQPGVLTGIPAISLASGFIDFRNRVPGIPNSPDPSQVSVDAPVIGPDGYRLAGPNFVAQLHISDFYTGGELRPVGRPIPLGTGQDAGYWDGGADSLIELVGFGSESVAIGAEIWVWDITTGATPEQATGLKKSSGGYSIFTGTRERPGRIAYFPSVSFPPRTVDLRNLVPPAFDNPVLGEDGARLGDTNYVAQMIFLGPNSSIPKPFGTPMRMLSGALAGYWDAGDNPVRFIEGVNDRQLIFASVRVWNITTGQTYEAATGPKLETGWFWFFGGFGLERPGLMDAMPRLSLAKFAEPTVIGYFDPSLSPQVADIDSKPLDRPGFVGQLFAVRTLAWSFASSSPGLTGPVGPVAPVGTGAQAGRWLLPANTPIPFGHLIPAQIRPSGFYSASVEVELRVWEQAKGATFQEAVGNGSEIGQGLTQVGYYHTSDMSGLLRLPTARLVGLGKRLSVGPGLTLIGNPFGVSSITFDQVMATPPDGTQLFVFNNATHTYEGGIFDFGAWNPPTMPVPPAGGFFVLNPGQQNIDVNLFGRYQAPARIERPATQAAYFCVSCGNTTPCAFADFTGAPPVEGDQAFRFAAASWEVSTFSFGAWDKFDPVLAPGEAIFLRLMPKSQAPRE